MRNAVMLCSGLVAAVLLAAPLACSALAEEPGPRHVPAEGETVRLLTVGNSFSGNATWLLPQLAKAGGKKLLLKRADIGGCWLERHWRTVEAFEADPNDPNGLHYLDDDRNNVSLKYWLTKEPWDVVTIQQLSTISHHAHLYQPFARNLRDYIRKHAPSAEVVFHQTWHYRPDDPRFTGDDYPDYDTFHDMHRQVRSAYHKNAQLLGLRIIPVGDAFYLASTDPKWAFRPDPNWNPAEAEHPQRPTEANSLHEGWVWYFDRKAKEHRLRMDGHHANTAGRYLGACVFYEFLFGDSVVGNSYRPKGMSEKRARFLQRCAHRAAEAMRVGDKSVAAPARPAGPSR